MKSNTHRAVVDLAYAFSDLIEADETKPQQFVRNLTRCLIHIEAARKCIEDSRKIARLVIRGPKNGQGAKPLPPNVSPE